MDKRRKTDSTVTGRDLVVSVHCTGTLTAIFLPLKIGRPRAQTGTIFVSTTAAELNILAIAEGMRGRGGQKKKN